MANQKHLDLIRQGIVVWNGWRELHERIQPDLCDADLSEVDLHFADLRGAYW
jgi:Pentapeptide repeats (8 copies).